MGFLLGIVFLAAAVWAARKAYRDSRVIEKEKFERRNPFGLEEFESFEDYKAADRRERSSAGAGAFLGCTAMVLAFIGVALIFGSFGSLLSPR